jgi:hypothetical protein
MTSCTSDHCEQTEVPMFRRSHSPSACPAAPPRRCNECGQVKPDVPALLAAPIYSD